MARKKVSSKTHTRQQLNDYANQNNPNNKAYLANKMNQVNQRKKSRKSYINIYDLGLMDGESYGWNND